MNEGSFKTQQDSPHHSLTLLQPKSWLSNIDFIHHLVFFSQKVITVLSEKTGGKTTFGDLLLANLDSQIKSLRITITAPCDLKSIINQIAAQLHLNVYSDSNIESIVCQINERKALVFLLIDNAQQLPEAMVKELINTIKNQDDGGFFHLCLLSDYSLLATLNKFLGDQSQDLIYTLEVGALSENETKQYVKNRAIDTLLVEMALTDQQHKQFYELTNGTIAQINSRLESFVLKDSSAPERKKMVLDKRVVISVPVMILVSLTIMFLSPLLEKPKLINPQISSIEPLPLVQDITTVDGSKQPISYVSSFLEVGQVELVSNPLAKKQVLTSSVNDPGLVHPDLKIIQRARIISQSKPQSVMMSHLEKVPPREHLLENKQIDSPANKYTILIESSLNQATLLKLKEHNPSLAAAKIRFYTSTGGKKWYVLTLRDFSERKQAQENINQLPEKLAKLNPWIRSLSGLENVN